MYLKVKLQRLSDYVSKKYVQLKRKSSLHLIERFGITVCFAHSICGFLLVAQNVYETLLQKSAYDKR